MGESRFLEVKLLLAADAKFALLDEPLAQLSPLWKEKVSFMIREASQTKGIILSDHNYHDIAPLVNKLYLMRNGNLKEIQNESSLKSLGYLP